MDEITLTADVTGDVTIPAGREIVLHGGTHALNGVVTLGSSTDGSVGKFTADNVRFDGTGSDAWAIICQRQDADSGKSSFEVSLTDCTVMNYTRKGLYATELTKLVLQDCTFTQCATDAMNEPNTYGDYVVDLNLMGVQDVVVEVKDCTFSSNGAQKALVKVAARGGESDADASDVPDGISTTVDSLVFQNCSLSGNSAAATVAVGTSNKSAESNPDAANTTGDFDVSVSGCTSQVIVSTPADGKTYTVEVGQTLVKEGASEPVVS